MIREAYLGFAPADGKALTRFFSERKVPMEAAERLGLIRRSQNASPYYQPRRGVEGEGRFARIGKAGSSLESGEILLSPETPSKGIGSGFARPIPQPGGSGDDRRSPPLEDRLSRGFAGALHPGNF